MAATLRPVHEGRRRRLLLNIEAHADTAQQLRDLLHAIADDLDDAVLGASDAPVTMRRHTDAHAAGLVRVHDEWKER